MNHGGYKLGHKEKPKMVCFYCGNKFDYEKDFEMYLKKEGTKLYLCAKCFKYLTDNQKTEYDNY